MRLLSELQRLDRRVYDSVTSLGPPVLDRISPRFVQATDNMAPWIATAALMALSGDARARRTAVRAMLAASAADGAATLVLKRVFPRARPDMSGVPAARLPRKRYRSSAFPSGHTAAAAGFAFGVMADAPRPLNALVGVLAGAVALSRVHSGVHYPGDVLGGVAVGAGAALAARALVPPRPRPAGAARTTPVEECPGDEDGRGMTAVVNPDSAQGALPMPGPAPADRIRRELPRARIVEIGPGDDLPAVVDEAAAHCEVLAVSGGDGTVNAGARAAVAHGRPLLVLPSGTFDNFARTLGLASIEAAVRAYREGALARVDVGAVDGRVFVNTASFGSYPRLVDERERLQHRMGKWAAFTLASWRALRDIEPSDVLVNGERRSVWWAFIGNCRYRTRALAPSRRERLDDGVLDVRVLSARRPFPRLRAVPDVLLGRWGLSEGYAERRSGRLVIGSLDGGLRLAVDGESFAGPAELVFSKRPGALRVFVPAPLGRGGTAKRAGSGRTARVLRRVPGGRFRARRPHRCRAGG